MSEKESLLKVIDVLDNIIMNLVSSNPVRLTIEEYTELDNKLYEARCLLEKDADA
jgi:hypothetical protein